MRKFFQEFKFEFDSMFNIHRQSIALLFAIPMLYTLLFAGLFYRNSVTNVPIIICNLDAGTHGRSISRDLFDTPEIEVVAMETNPIGIETQMEKFGASGAVVIPRDFSKKINELQPTSVELILDNSNTVLGGTVSRAVQSVVAAHNAIVTVNQRVASGWDLYQSQSAMISMSSRVLYNPTGGCIDFFLAALIIHAGQIAAVFVLAPSIVIEKRFRGSEILDRLTAYLTSKLILYSTFELVTISICLETAIDGFGMICRGNFLEILALILSFIIRMVSFALMFAASAYALLIGNLYRGEIIQNIPAAVCDLDDSALSRELIRDVADADQYDFRGVLTDEVSAVSMMERGSIAAVLIIPEDFSEKFYSMQAIDLAFLQDGSNTLQSGYSALPMQMIIAKFSAECNSHTSIVNGTPTLPIAPISLSARINANPTQSYLEFYIYGIVLVAAQIGLIMGFSMSVYDDLKNGFFVERGITITLFTKEVLYLILSLISILIAIFWLVSIFDLPLRGDFGKILLICTAFLFAVENLAGIAAMYFKTRLALVQCMVFYTLPAFLLSGYIWPEIGMVGIVEWISCLQPVHYILMDFRQLALVGIDSAYWDHVLILTALGMMSMILLTSFLHFGHGDKLSSNSIIKHLDEKFAE